MYDFTSVFLSPIGSLVFSQILDSIIMIKPRVSKALIKLMNLLNVCSKSVYHVVIQIMA